MKDGGVHQSGWNAAKQERLDTLSAGELIGRLSESEQRELGQLVRELETDERQRLTPALEQMRREQAVLRRKVLQTQVSNERLAAVVAQQEQMLVDARRTLSDLQRRHQVIRDSYFRVTGEALVPA
jgi:uncharacterized lipoprotein